MPKRPSARPAAADTATHPIQIVTLRTGLSADVVRVWEKRYGAVAPMRSASGRRLYADADIERLRLLAQATLDGHMIGQIAHLPNESLAGLFGDGRPVGNRVGRPPRDAAGREDAPPPARDHLAAVLSAVEAFDGVVLDTLLRRASVALSAEAFLDTLVVPLAERVATQVRDGTLRPAHRHLAYAVLRRVLDHVIAVATSPLASPDLVVTTPSGQSQELGALVFAAAAAAEGWRVTYMGPGLPAEDVADTVARVGASAVLLSLGAVPGDRVVPRELRHLRTLLPPDVTLLVEGAAADVHRSVLKEIEAVVLANLDALRAQLRAHHTAQRTAADADGK
jgi:hypothetical protein